MCNVHLRPVLRADSGEEHHAEAEQRFSALQALVVLLPDAHREALRLLLAFTARLARLAHRHQVTLHTLRHTHTYSHTLSLFRRERKSVCVLRASISSSLILPLLLRPPRGCELSCPPPTESLCRLAHYSVNSLVSSHIREQYAQTRTLFKQNKHANRLYLWCRSQFGGLELCASTTTTISFRFQTLLCSSPAIHKPILSPIRNFFVLWRILPFLTIQN